MCGINAIIGKVTKSDLRISAMNKSLKHRGPDFQGSFISNKFALGHTRLSIIDLSISGNQPMSSACNKHHLIFNGEVINYKDIQKEYFPDLIPVNDSYIVLQSLIKYGSEWCIENFRGMFAFFFVNEHTNEYTLGRDKFGIKPLYYSETEKNIVISSEINGILSSGLVKPKINNKQIYNYFSERHVKAPNTLYEKIFQVIPGETIIWKNNVKTSIVNRDIAGVSNLDISLDELMEKTIKSWSISDVKVGTYLSGGLDSSLISAILKKHVKNLESWCALFEEKGFDESMYAEKVAKSNNINLNKIILTYDEFLELTEDLILKKGLPLSVPNEISLTEISKSMKGDIVVALSGEGADELFGGYDRIMSQEEGDAADFFNTYNYVPENILLSLGINIDEKITSHNLFNEVQGGYQYKVFNYFRKYHLEGLLMRVDFTSMQNSIETRPCFVDVDLFKYVTNNYPLQSLFDKKVGKKPLKKIAEKFLDKEIVYRKKIGFPVPLNSFYKKTLFSIRKLINHSNIINKDKFENSLISILKTYNYGQILWMILNLLIWEKQITNYENRIRNRSF